MHITDLVSKLAPSGFKYAQALERSMITAGIQFELEQEHFIAQVAFESNAFRSNQEQLTYTATRLREVFPTHFPNMAIANEYAYRAERIANRVYASRMGNGDEASGDGYRFRGRGLIQLTGRANYTACAGAVGHDLVHSPDEMLIPNVSSDAAVWFWKSRGCGKYAMLDDIKGVTKLINGGLNGLAGRVEWLSKVRAIAKAQQDAALHGH